MRFVLPHAFFIVWLCYRSESFESATIEEICKSGCLLLGRKT